MEVPGEFALLAANGACVERLKTPMGKLGEFPVSRWDGEVAEGVFIVSVFDTDLDFSDPKKRAAFVRGLRNGMINSMQAVVSQETTIKRGRASGVLLEGTLPDASPFRAEFFLVDKRTFALVAATKDARLSAAFFEGFRILGPQKFRAEGLEVPPCVAAK